MYGDQAMEPYSHSGWTSPSRLVPWQRGHKLLNSFCVLLESLLLSFHVYSLLWPVKGAGNVKLISKIWKGNPSKNKECYSVFKFMYGDDWCFRLMDMVLHLLGVKFFCRIAAHCSSCERSCWTVSWSAEVKHTVICK